MSGKSATAAAAVLQLQQQHHFESIQIVKLVPSLVIINELLSKLFNLLPFPALFLVLQLQQQCCNCSSLLNPLRISNYPCVPSMVIINELLLELFNLLPFPALFLETVLQQQCCSCSSSTLLNQFKMLNYFCIPSMVIIYKILSELFNLLPLPALYLEKVLQLQQQYCSCSCSTFLNQLKISNYPCIPNLVIKYHREL